MPPGLLRRQVLRAAVWVVANPVTSKSASHAPPSASGDVVRQMIAPGRALASEKEESERKKQRRARRRTFRRRRSGGFRRTRRSTWRWTRRWTLAVAVVVAVAGAVVVVMVSTYAKIQSQKVKIK